MLSACGRMGGRGLEAPPLLFSFFIHPRHPRHHGQPRSLALLATAEWMSKGPLGSPGPRWLGPERWLEVQSCRSGPLGRGLGTSLQGQLFWFPPYLSQGGISPGGEKQVREAAVLCRLRPAGGSRSARMGAPQYRLCCAPRALKKGLWRTSRAS